MVTPQTPTMNVAITRNGAKGISERNEYFRDSANKHIPTMPPIQNANNSALSPPVNPNSQPIPSASFTSPKPIHRPLEMPHNKKNGSATTTPENIAGPI